MWIYSLPATTGSKQLLCPCMSVSPNKGLIMSICQFIGINPEFRFLGLSPTGTHQATLLSGFREGTTLFPCELYPQFLQLFGFLCFLPCSYLLPYSVPRCSFTNVLSGPFSSRCYNASSLSLPSQLYSPKSLCITYCAINKGKRKLDVWTISLSPICEK